MKKNLLMLSIFISAVCMDVWGDTFALVNDLSTIKNGDEVVFVPTNDVTRAIKAGSSVDFAVPSSGYSYDVQNYSYCTLDLSVAANKDFVFTIVDKDEIDHVYLYNESYGYIGSSCSAGTGSVFCYSTKSDAKKWSLSSGTSGSISADDCSNSIMCLESNRLAMRTYSYVKYGSTHHMGMYKKVLTVTLNANGGTCSPSAMYGPGVVELPFCAAPTGKRFMGWSSTSDKAGIVPFTYNVLADVTLTAIYEDIDANGTYMLATESSDMDGARQIVLLWRYRNSADSWKYMKCDGGWLQYLDDEASVVNNSIVNPSSDRVFCTTGRTSYLWSLAAHQFICNNSGRMSGSAKYPWSNNSYIYKWIFPSSADPQIVVDTDDSPQMWSRSGTYGGCVYVTDYAASASIELVTYVKKTSYTVSFNVGEGADVAYKPADMFVIGSCTLPSIAVTKAGYVHSGWKDTYGGSITIYDINGTYSPKDNVTLTAIYNMDAVIYVAGEGTFAGTQMTVETDHVDALPACYPVEGKHFLGWSTDPNATTPSYLTGDEFDVSGIVRLYAIYAKKEQVNTFYQVTTAAAVSDTILMVLSDGHTGDNAKSYTLSATIDGSDNAHLTYPEISLDTAFMSGNYAIWQIASASNLSGAKKKTKGNYAMYYADIYVDPNYGYLSAQNNYGKTIPHTSSYSFIPTGDGHFYVKTGDSYICYYSNVGSDPLIKTCAGSSKFNQWASNSNLAYGAAAWTIYKEKYGYNYVVQFDAGEGTITGQRQFMQPAVVLLKDEVSSPEGYRLLGWASTREKSTSGIVDVGAPGVVLEPVYDQIVYAVYSPIIYEYTFNNVDLSISEALDENPLTGSIISQITIPDVTMTDNHYQFMGWSTTENGMVEYMAGQVITPTSDLELYAIYQQLNNVKAGDNYYATIAEALTHSNSLQLIFDVTENLTVADGQVLSIDGNGKTITGDVTIKQGGKLTLTGALTISNLYLESATAKSSQLIGNDNLTITGDAYVDITLIATGSLDANKWYGFAVPFGVAVDGGFFQADGTPISKDDIWVAYYDGEQRSKTSDGWVYPFEGELTPGKFYMITSDITDNIIRLKKSSAFAANGNLILSAYADYGATVDQGWNALANPMPYYTTATGGPTLAQVYDNTTNAYNVVTLASVTFTMGCPYFVQSAAGAISMTAGDQGLYYAPAREQARTQLYCIDFQENSNSWSDHLYLSASEDATDTYQIGRDLGKMRANTIPQIWANAYGYSLCAQDAPMEDNAAEFDITLYAPKAGDYTLTLSESSDYEVLVMQNGSLVWNLSMSPWMVSMPKGMNNSYSIRMEARKLPTDIRNTKALQQSQKMVVKGMLFIQYNGQVFNAQGVKLN